MIFHITRYTIWHDSPLFEVGLFFCLEMVFLTNFFVYLYYHGKIFILLTTQFPESDLFFDGDVSFGIVKIAGDRFDMRDI